MLRYGTSATVKARIKTISATARTRDTIPSTIPATENPFTPCFLFMAIAPKTIAKILGIIENVQMPTTPNTSDATENAHFVSS